MSYTSSYAHKIRSDFPGLHQEINGHPLSFLDSAASAQKPRAMLDSLKDTYEHHYANIHRGVYHLSEIATRRFEEVRGKVATFIGAEHENTVIFTKGATESINLVAASLTKKHISHGDEIIISHMEHHANIVPWQVLCQRTGATLKVIPITDNGELDLTNLDQLISEKTKLLAITHMSNALGTITPIKELVAAAKKVGALTLVDACQSIVHVPVNVRDIDCDFLVFSAHKLYGPNGVGILYGKPGLLDTLDVYQTGGEMIDKVSFEGTTYNKAPLKFEAGTPAIAEVIAFGATLDYLNTVDYKLITQNEMALLEFATKEIQALKGFKIIGTAKHKACVLSFTHNQAHPSDIGMILDQCAVAVRTGHHCAQPLMDRLGLSATARISIAMYTTKEDIESAIKGLHKVNTLFGS